MTRSGPFAFNLDASILINLFKPHFKFRNKIQVQGNLPLETSIYWLKLKAAPLERTNNCDLCLLTQQIINHAYLVPLNWDFA